MALFKCKMCGGAIEVEQGTTVCTCVYCGTQQTLPKLDDERRAGMFDRANHFRRNNEFDKASGIFEQILNEDSTDAEAYWSLVLCRYGIEYVEDPATHKRLPTVNRAQYTSIYADEDYKAAIANADTLQKTVYEAEAKTIDEIQKGILAISSKEEPFDVFISFKETGTDGKRTRDAVLAHELYNELEKEGYKTFFAPVTLEDKLGTEYEPYIFAALNSAKVMVVLGTKPEHFNAVWVKNEWSRFLSLIKNGAKKTLIPAYKDMDPYDLPEEFSNLLAQDMNKLGFMQDLLRGIKKITAADEPKPAVKETVIVNNASSAPAGNIAPLLERAFMFLEDGDWNSANDYCEKVLDQDPKNAQAYLGKLMAELRVRKTDALQNCAQPFDENNNYKKALRFADGELAEKLKSDIEFITERNALAQKTETYNKAKTAMNAAQTESACKAASLEFEKISGFKDADELRERCLEKAEECRKDAIYNNGVNLMNRGLVSYYATAIVEFQKVAGWKDSEEQIRRCNAAIEELRAKEKAAKEETERKEEEARLAAEKAAKKRKKTFAALLVVAALAVAGYFGYTKVLIPTQNYNAAVALMNAGSYEKALSAFKALDGYKDSASKIEACQTAIKDQQYEEAVTLKDSGKYEEAYAIFAALSGYKDVDSIIKNDKNIAAAARKAYLEQFKTGGTVMLGSFEQDNNISNGKEPIEWTVLANDGKKALLFSKYALDAIPYNKERVDITWEKCSLRTWLNSDFYDSAFSEEEKTKILKTAVSADNNPEYSTDPGKATEDSVFLLSAVEAEKYFATDEARKCVPTEYATVQGAYTSSSYTSGGKATCWWWLRSPGFYQDYAAAVRSGGSVVYLGDGVDYGYGCVRPALWINLET